MVNENIKLVRDVWKMQQVEMSEILNITSAKLGFYENGKTVVPTDVLLRLEKLTGITMRRLLEDELTRSMIYKEPINVYENGTQAREAPPQYFRGSEDETASESNSIIERLERINQFFLSLLFLNIIV